MNIPVVGSPAIYSYTGKVGDPVVTVHRDVSGGARVVLWDREVVREMTGHNDFHAVAKMILDLWNEVKNRPRS